MCRGRWHVSVGWRSSAAQTHQQNRHGGSSLHSTTPYLRLAWLSLPLGLATASLSLTTSIPRYWISARLGNAALGGFAVAGSLMIAMSYVVGALSQAASPRLARHHAAGDRAAFLRLLGQLGLWLAVVTIASVAVMAIGSRLVIGLLFGPAFVTYAVLATCLMLAAGLRNFSILLGLRDNFDAAISHGACTASAWHCRAHCAAARLDRLARPDGRGLGGDAQLADHDTAFAGSSAAIFGVRWLAIALQNGLCRSRI